MEFEWDLSEFEEFANKLESLNGFEEHMKKAAKDISKVLLKRIKSHTPILDYDLINAWDDNKFLVTETKQGYEVLLVNKMEYATWVNDGHKQRPGRFVPGIWLGVKRFVYIKGYPRGMVLKEPWVKGRFFVEKGIVSLKNTSAIEEIIMRELQKWWESV